MAQAKNIDDVIIEDNATLADGLKLTTSRALIFKTVGTIRKILNFISIAMPLVFAAFYIFFIAVGETSGHKFVINCIMLPLVIAELTVNAVMLARERDKENTIIEKRSKKVLYYIKFAVSVITCSFAIYEAFTYDVTAVEIIISSVMLAILFVRILFEILKIVAEKYFNMMMLAVAMDLKKVVNKKTIKGATAVVNAISNPKLAAINAFDKVVQRIADKKDGCANDSDFEEVTEEPTMFEKLVERANSNDKTRIYLSRLASEYKEECAEENFKKKQEREAELEKRKNELKDHLFNAFGNKKQ